jgi:23S rRNA G2069 N7-methylase RlmK/C1962 C5-methylase RlmI
MSLRVQGPHERGRFTAEAWGYLVTLHESRVVSSFDFEQLVERALFHMDGRIGLSEIRTLADEVGLDAASLAADRTLLH